ncbi:MAG: HEAT repeat domain-containing protein [Planctomycetota bacterium]|jgi:HEAT repeat protein
MKLNQRTACTAVISFIILSSLCFSAESEDEKDKATQIKETVAAVLSKKTPWPERDRLLVKIGTFGEDALDVIVKMLDNKELDMRISWPLVRAIENIGTGRSINELKKLLERNDRVSHRALNALGRMENSTAQNAVLTFKAETKNWLEVKIISLEPVPTYNATEFLINHLFHKELMISSRSRQMLYKRAKKDIGISNMIDMIGDKIDDIEDIEELKGVAHVRSNIVKLALKLPKNAGYELFIQCLNYKEDTQLQKSAIEAIRKKPKLAKEDNILEAILTYMDQENQAPEQIIKCLDIFRLSNQKKATKTAAHCLYFENRGIIMKAAQTLETLTGLKHGRNPQSWKPWANKKYGLPKK